jgi:hypothetical protein
MAMIISAAELLLIRAEYSAKFAGNFAMKKRRGGREFKSNADNRSVSRVAPILENRSKSARVRAICDDPRTRRALSAPICADRPIPLRARFTWVHRSSPKIRLRIQHVKRRVTERGEYFAGDDRAVYRPQLLDETRAELPVARCGSDAPGRRTGV